MNDDNNLTPEEIEELKKEEAQQNTGPNLYDKLGNLKNNIDTAKKIKKIIDERKLKNLADSTKAAETINGATGTGTTAAGTGTAATGTGTAVTGTGAAVTGTGAAVTDTGAAVTGTGAAVTGTGAAVTGTGAAAAGTGTAAAGTGAAATTPVGWIVLIVIAVILVIMFLVLFFSLMYYNVIEPVSSKYSVSEDDIVNKYDINFVGDEDCQDYSEVGGICNVTDTDVDKLDELFDDEEPLGLWQSINHLWYQLTGNPLWNVSEELASLILKDKVDQKLEIMGKLEDKNELPMGALISTLAYTYSSQYMKLDYKNYDDIYYFEGSYIELPDENRINPTNPSSTLSSLLNEDILSTKNPDDIGNLLDNMVFHEFYPTYSWGEVDRKCEYDDDGNVKSCTIYVGCSRSDNESYKLDYYKYYLYLRYGAYISGYATNEYPKSWGNLYSLEGTEKLWGKTDIENYKEDSDDTIAFGYEYFKNLNAAYISSSTECRLKEVANESLDELKASSDENITYEMIEGRAEHSVDRANNFFKARDVTNGVDEINNNHEIFDNVTKYDKKANAFSSDDLIPKIKIDNTIPSGNGDFAVNYNNGEDYEYQHGWIYNRFPFYREEFQLEENKEFEYDSVVTPKDIERFIENIDDQKEVFDAVLGYDTSVYASNSWSSSFNSDGTESFPLPVGKYTITSCVGERTIDGQFSKHGGIDIAVSRGTPLYAWKSGIVVRTNNSCGEGYYGSNCGGGYGNFVVIDHGEINGERQYTIYAHMSNTYVLVGDEVSAGQQIGTSGNSGSSTGPHLHFEIRTGGTEWSNSTKQDPYPTLAEIVGGQDLPDVCTEGTVLDVQSTLINGNQTNSENKQQLCKLLVSKFSQNGAIALMANAAHESGYNTSSNGDSGTSYGLFQWHNERKQSLMSSYPNSYNTVQSQYNYLLTELNGYSSLYNDLISGNKSSKELTYDFCYNFERPVNKEMSCKNRMSSTEYSDAESYVKNGCQ